jgi:hypothetical protein
MVRGNLSCPFPRRRAKPRARDVQRPPLIQLVCGADLATPTEHRWMNLSATQQQSQSAPVITAERDRPLGGQ